MIDALKELLENRLREAEDKEREDRLRQKKFTSRAAPPLEEVPQTAHCGNCAFISYHGINEVSLRVGECDNYNSSNTLAVFPHMVCPFWKPRSQGKMISERAYANKMQEVVAQINQGIRSRTGMPKVAVPKRPKELDDKPKEATGLDMLRELGLSLGVTNTAPELEDEEEDEE